MGYVGSGLLKNAVLPSIGAIVLAFTFSPVSYTHLLLNVADICEFADTCELDDVRP